MNKQELNFVELAREDRVEITQQLKQLYFHAGRWSAGARDYTARSAYHAYNVIETRNTGKVR